MAQSAAFKLNELKYDEVQSYSARTRYSTRSYFLLASNIWTVVLSSFASIVGNLLMKHYHSA